MSADGRSCETCEYCSVMRGGPYEVVGSLQRLTTCEDRWFCHIDPIGFEGRWPETRADGWCGKWARARNLPLHWSVCPGEGGKAALGSVDGEVFAEIVKAPEGFRCSCLGETGEFASLSDAVDKVNGMAGE